jgi:hypothetical protein
MEEAGVGQREDMLGPLRAALDRMTELTQLVEGFKLKPLEMELKEISRKLANSKVRYNPLPCLTCSQTTRLWPGSP